MKIAIDQAIPFIKGILEPYAEIEYLDGQTICKADLEDVNALVVLHNTKCNRALLEGTPVELIATATIGTDHIDLAYCKNAGIFVQNAPGCNSGGVMNYVFSALYGAASRERIPLAGSTMGIVGVGQVGSRVENVARQLGFKVLLCDPPRAEAEGPAQFVSLDYLLENSDIVTMHVPLNDSTRGMADAAFFGKMKFGAFFMNTSRGEVVVDEALIDAAPRLGPIILDNWNNEPYINLDLLEKATIATPHIAGYSYQGKQRATSAVVRSVARFFKIEALYDFFPPAEVKELEAVRLNVSGLTQGQIASIIQYNYPVFTDDFLFRVNPGNFDEFRRLYRYRREFYI